MKQRRLRELFVEAGCHAESRPGTIFTRDSKANIGIDRSALLVCPAVLARTFAGPVLVNPAVGEPGCRPYHFRLFAIHTKISPES